MKTNENQETYYFIQNKLQGKLFSVFFEKEQKLTKYSEIINNHASPYVIFFKCPVFMYLN